MNLLEDKEFLEFQGLAESANLLQISEILDQTWERLDNRGPEQIGDKLPWPKTHDYIRLRPGELSLWAGINGHGKSLILGQIILWLPYAVKSVIASLEMPVAATAARMCRQTLPSGNPSRQYLEQFADSAGNLWLYDQVQTVKTERMLALCMYAGQILGADHIVIDSLVKCGIAQDDYPRQKEFADALCQLAKAYQMHIHLVHHMRKGRHEDDPPDKMDIKGAGELTDLADNVFIMHRNKRKERQMENGQHVEELDPDAELWCLKQRHGEWEGKVNLYFDKHSHQYMGGPSSRLQWRSE